MTPWLGLVAIHSVLRVQTYAFHVSMAANPFVSDKAVRRLQRETLHYTDYRRIWGYEHDEVGKKRNRSRVSQAEHTRAHRRARYRKHKEAQHG